MEDQQVSRCSSFPQCRRRNHIFVSWHIKAVKSQGLQNKSTSCSANTGNSSARECTLYPTYHNQQKNVAAEEKTFNWFLVGLSMSCLYITVTSRLVCSVVAVFLLASPWQHRAQAQSSGGQPAGLSRVGRPAFTCETGHAGNMERVIFVSFSSNEPMGRQAAG